MILADSSAWVEFLRGTGSAAAVALRDLLGEPHELATTDVVLMELLAGARTRPERDRLRALLARCRYAPVHGPSDYEAAADLYRACRSGGATVRTVVDCLIAAVAIREDLALLHADGDFDQIAGDSELRLA